MKELIEEKFKEGEIMAQGKWAKVVADLQDTPGEWQKIADHAPSSTVSRLRELGALVRTSIAESRTGDRTYDRYTVHACWPLPGQEELLDLEATVHADSGPRKHRSNAKWPKVIADLQADPGVWKEVADNAGPSTIQRLRELGAEVQTDSVAPRTGGVTYSRYTVWARWPTPTTELERIELEHSKLKDRIAELRHDVDAAEEEYISDKKRLNRSSYRRKQAREKYEPALNELDQLTALLNRLKTEKD